jgi:hypothetical protein
VNLPPYFMVFDVESVGLHGDGFAVGWVVIDTRTGQEVEAQRLFTTHHAARGRERDREWVQENVRIEGAPVYRLPCMVRDAFWAAWARWRDEGAWLAADVAWPVEARFLAACVDDVNGRDWGGPYPLVDIASVRLAAGLDPRGTVPRREDEEPAHDPLADARQSARLLMEALAAVRPPQPVEVA